MSIPYFLVKYIGKLALPVFFGKLEINGKSNIPTDRPFIIAPNHQNAFLDAVLMGVFNSKEVHFLTRSDVFVAPFIRALKSLNMMPVYRIRDGYDKLSKNDEIFERCVQLLKEATPVLIFPEGNMDEGHFLRPLTKGISRLAFQAQDSLEEDLLILPVGINYFHHYRPRYKCIINFGPPLEVQKYYEQVNVNKARALIQLRDDLTLRIKRLMLIPNKESYLHKTTALNRANERFDFGQMRSKIETDNFQTVKYFNWVRYIRIFLIPFNPVSILLIRYLLTHKIKDIQFRLSIKYTLGLVLSIIWWLILFLICLYFFNLLIAFGVVLISIVLLFLRADLAKFIDPKV